MGDSINGANTPLRLHSKLLFYGLDAGTWSDPPKNGMPPMPQEGGPCEAASTPVYGMEGGAGPGAGGMDAAVPSDPYMWQHYNYSGAVWETPSAPSAAYIINQNDWQQSAVVEVPLVQGSNVKAAAEPSTDEGSEPKGSESESLPESSEGYLRPQGMMPAVQQQVPTMMPYISGPQVQVATHTVQAEAANMYPTYMPHDGYNMSTHSFGAGSEASQYPYTSAAGFQQNVLPQSAAGAGVVPSIGSYAHLSGQCSRCCFHPKGRCANGYSCQFCHFDHEKRPRNGKKKRYRRGPDDMCEEGIDD